MGHETVVGVCPAWGNDEIPLPGDDMPLPDTDDRPLFGSGFNFLNAPSAVWVRNGKNSHVFTWA